MKKVFLILLVLGILLAAACVSNESGMSEPTEEPSIVTAEPTEEPQAERSELPDDIDEEKLAELRRSARWLFEQQVLPSVVFGDDDSDIIAQFMSESDVDSVKEILTFFWEFTVETMISYELEGAFSPDELDLGPEHIMEVTIETLEEGWIASIIKMYDIEQWLISTYIGIVYSEIGGFRFYTLEQGEGFYMFCFRNRIGRGSIGQIENNREAFIEAIIGEL